MNNNIIFVSTLGVHDVLLGRGTGPNENEGNRKFRQTAAEMVKMKGVIETSDTETKRELAVKLVSIVHSRHGRFVRKLNKDETATTRRQSPATPPAQGHAGSSSSGGGNKNDAPLASSSGHKYVVVPDHVAIEKCVQRFSHEIRLLSKTKCPSSSLSRTTPQDATRSFMQPHHLGSTPPTDSFKCTSISNIEEQIAGLQQQQEEGGQQGRSALSCQVVAAADMMGVLARARANIDTFNRTNNEFAQRSSILEKLLTKQPPSGTTNINTMASSEAAAPLSSARHTEQPSSRPFLQSETNPIWAFTTSTTSARFPGAANSNSFLAASPGVHAAKEVLDYHQYFGNISSPATAGVGAGVGNPFSPLSSPQQQQQKLPPLAPTLNRAVTQEQEHFQALLQEYCSSLPSQQHHEISKLCSSSTTNPDALLAILRGQTAHPARTSHTISATTPSLSSSSLHGQQQQYLTSLFGPSSARNIRNSSNNNAAAVAAAAAVAGADHFNSSDAVLNRTTIRSLSQLLEGGGSLTGSNNHNRSSAEDVVLAHLLQLEQQQQNQQLQQQQASKPPAAGSRGQIGGIQHEGENPGPHFSASSTTNPSGSLLHFPSSGTPTTTTAAAFAATIAANRRYTPTATNSSTALLQALLDEKNFK